MVITAILKRSKVHVMVKSFDGMTVKHSYVQQRRDISDAYRKSLVIVCKRVLLTEFVVQSLEMGEAL